MGNESGDGPIEASRDVDQPPLLDAVVPLNLKLWLTAGKGITCASGRVTKWADQSGAGRDATLKLGQLGPQCQGTPAPHVINGIDVPYFSAPANGNVVDETLDVDLSFLVNTGYTLFVVERRWFDSINSEWSENILGTNVSSANESNPSCGSGSSSDTVLQFGYIYFNNVPQFSYDQHCDNAVFVKVSAVSQMRPPPVSQETAMFDPTLGKVLWQGGTPLGSNIGTSPLRSATDGALGRAVIRTTASTLDGRFRGDIAEILVYDAALGGADRVTVEGYLKGHWKY